MPEHRNHSEYDQSQELRLGEIDRICDSFSETLNRGAPAKEGLIETFVDAVAHRLVPELLPELVALEVEWRRAHEQAVTLQEYADRFPRYVDTLVELFPDESYGNVKRVGDYVIERKIGEGAVGIVYQAVQPRTERRVAIKVLPKASVNTASDYKQYCQEVQTIAGLEHPNIVSLIEADEDEYGIPYYSMELVAGGSLATNLRENRRVLESRAAATLIRTLASAIETAHQEGVIHRDLKPDNVLLCLDGTPKIADFGLAWMAVEGQTATVSQLAGTPSYMAPEQVDLSFGSIGPQTDVYGLGAILYECLCGRSPFKGVSELATMDQVRHQPPARLREINKACPKDIETICLKCLEKSPEDRYQSAQELADDLDRFLAGRPIHARAVGKLEKAVKWSRRHPVVATLAAMLLLTLTVFGATAYFQNNQIIANGRRAQENFERAFGAIETYFTLVSEDDRLVAEDLAPLRRDLLLSAEDFYKQLAETSSTSPQAKDKLALCYVRLGFMQDMLGDISGALERYVQAEELLRELIKEQPDSDDLRANLAFCLFYMKTPLLDLGDYERVSEVNQELIALCESIQDSFPSSETNKLLQSALTTEALISIQTGQFDHAQELLHHLTNDAETYLSSSDKLAFAAHLNDLAGMNQRIPRTIDMAIEKGMAAYAMLERIPASDHDDDYQQTMGSVCYNLGLAYTSTKDVDQCEKFLQLSVDFRRDLQEKHSTRVHLKSDLAKSLSMLGYWNYSIGRKKDAIDAYREASDLVQEVANADPQVTSTQLQLARSRANLASLLLEDGHTEHGIRELKSARNVFATLSASHSEVPAYKLDLAQTEARLAEVYVELGQQPLAFAHLRQAITLYRDQLIQNDNPDYRAALARALIIRSAASQSLPDSVNDLDEAAALAQEISRDYPRAEYESILAVASTSLAWKHWLHGREGESRLALQAAMGVAKSLPANAEGDRIRLQMDLLGFALQVKSSWRLYRSAIDGDEMTPND